MTVVCPKADKSFKVTNNFGTSVVIVLNHRQKWYSTYNDETGMWNIHRDNVYAELDTEVYEFLFDTENAVEIPKMKKREEEEE